MEMAHALFSGRIETKKENLLALSPSRYGKHGKNVTMGKHASMTKASKVFLYDHVCIGDNLSVYNQKGKLIIRSGTRIGNHLHVTTFDSDKNMNVVIGRNVTIGDNVSLSAGTYIHDNEVIPSNTNL
jgi:acetyltransferase-like isoleucine patch superfamily enzyme